MIEYLCKLDEYGRITIPKDIRDDFLIDSKSELKLTLRNNEIIIGKKINECEECKSKENLIFLKEFHIYICKECVRKFVE